VVAELRRPVGDEFDTDEAVFDAMHAEPAELVDRRETQGGAMLPHPTVATLVGRHGNTADGRAAARRELETSFLVQVRQLAAEAGRSLRCRAGDHHRRDEEHGVVGCGNDGTGCLCDCHDAGTDR
jgi:hypothetical protein